MGLRLKRYGPVRTMFVVGWFPRAEVPTARSARTENKNKRMEAKTIAPTTTHDLLLEIGIGA